ncbi:MAG: hypothetical protein JSR96_00745 [Proteobacteria bacterium]|nr:hypothetical protein [Pseudomonadota bacterium]
MRTTFDSASARLYHLDGDVEGGAAQTLFYGPLLDALRLAEQQPDDVQQGLFIATDNDVVAYLDLIGEE